MKASGSDRDEDLGIWDSGLSLRGGRKRGKESSVEIARQLGCERELDSGPQFLVKVSKCKDRNPQIDDPFLRKKEKKKKGKVYQSL